MLNKTESKNSLISFFNDHYVKFKIRIIIYDMSDETNHQKLKLNIRFNIK